MQGQAQLCEDRGWHLVVVGNMNAYTDPALDRWGGRSAVRQHSLAMAMRECGMRDSFREKHPDLSALLMCRATGVRVALIRYGCKLLQERRL